MYNKYFTVEVKPDIDADLLGAAALADDDVIWSWWPFQIPKGSSRLLNVTARVTSTCGTAQIRPFQLFFAKSKVHPATGSISNPTSIGEYNTAANFVPSKNETIGALKIEAIDYMCNSLVGASVASTGNSVAANGSNIDMVLTPSGSDHANYELSHTLPSGVVLSPPSNVAITPGYDILWVAGVACSEFDFTCGVEVDGEFSFGGGTSVIHTDQINANIVFSPGDVIQEADNTVIGTIVSMSEAVGRDVDITVFSDQPANTVADGVVVYPRNPITLELSFEK